MERDLLLEGYRRVLRVRLFEEEVVAMVAAGEIGGGVHSSIGQEAAVVGACIAGRPDDYMVGTHRSHGHPIAKGAELGPLMAELLGKAAGVCHGKGGSMHLADFAVGSLGESSIVASGLPIGAGAALSAQVRGTDQVCLAFFGDGASNEGAFHEALNLSAVWKLPVIWICENNGYAITTSTKEALAVPFVSDRASAYAMPGARVDGQDFIAVYNAVRDAIATARAGGGPSLVELLTYRYHEHAQGMPISTQYRHPDEVAQWQVRDPVTLMEEHLGRQGISAREAEAVRSEVATEVSAAVAFARQSELPVAEDAYSDLFAESKGVSRGI